MLISEIDLDCEEIDSSSVDIVKIQVILGHERTVSIIFCYSNSGLAENCLGISIPALNVGLYDATTDSGNVTIAVDSKYTHKLESQTIDVGKIAEESGESTITGIIITFSEKDLPPNGSFMACAYSDVYDRSQCEVAERHYDVKSADVWMNAATINKVITEQAFFI